MTNTNPAPHLKWYPVGLTPPLGICTGYRTRDGVQAHVMLGDVDNTNEWVIAFTARDRPSDLAAALVNAELHRLAAYLQDFNAEVARGLNSNKPVHVLVDVAAAQIEIIGRDATALIRSYFTGSAED